MHTNRYLISFASQVFNSCTNRSLGCEDCAFVYKTNFVNAFYATLNLHILQTKIFSFPFY